MLSLILKFILIYLLVRFVIFLWRGFFFLRVFTKPIREARREAKRRSREGATYCQDTESKASSSAPIDVEFRVIEEGEK